MLRCERSILIRLMKSNKAMRAFSFAWVLLMVLMVGATSASAQSRAPMPDTPEARELVSLSRSTLAAKVPVYDLKPGPALDTLVAQLRRDPVGPTGTLPSGSCGTSKYQKWTVCTWSWCNAGKTECSACAINSNGGCHCTGSGWCGN